MLSRLYLTLCDISCTITRQHSHRGSEVGGAYLAASGKASVSIKWYIYLIPVSCDCYKARYWNTHPQYLDFLGSQVWGIYWILNEVNCFLQQHVSPLITINNYYYLVILFANEPVYVIRGCGLLCQYNINGSENIKSIFIPSNDTLYSNIVTHPHTGGGAWLPRWYSWGRQ